MLWEGKCNGIIRNVCRKLYSSASQAKRFVLLIWFSLPQQNEINFDLITCNQQRQTCRHKTGIAVRIF